MKVSAKRKNGPVIEVDYDFGADLKAMIAKFGEDIVFNHAKGSLVVALQGWLRSLTDRNKTADEIKKDAVNWKPGQRRQGKTAQEKVRDMLSKLTPEQRAQVLKEHKATSATK